MSAKQTIRETIVDTIGEHYAAQYGDLVDQVVEALNEREEALAKWVIDMAQQEYGYGEQAAEILAASAEGAFPTPVEPEPEQAPEQVSVDASLLERLVQFAERHGFRR